jgi:glycosyltransferase involved in cell wall biosynthesis
MALGSPDETSQQRAWARDYCRSVSVLEPRPTGVASRAFSLLTRTNATGRGREVAQWFLSGVRSLQPDVLHIEGPGIAWLAPLAPGLRSVLSSHDSLSRRYQEFARFARGLRPRLVARLREASARRLERQDFQLADYVVVTSSLDAAALASVVPQQKLVVIPNGVDVPSLSACPPAQPGRIVFTGNMSWPPNEDAAATFAREIFPTVRDLVPEAQFCVVGADPPAAVRSLGGLRGVTVTGTVDDLGEWISTASVYVSPLRFGAGVKNKILEAMARAAPIVATPASLTGFPLEHGRHLLIAKTNAEVADAVVRLLGDDALRAQLGRAARLKVETEHSWAQSASRFDSLYRNLKQASW